MNDLVGQLRNLKDETRYDALIAEAADRIEALEAALRRILERDILLYQIKETAEQALRIKLEGK